MGSLISQESQDESVTESSALKQATTETDVTIAQNGPTLGKHLQNSVQNESVADSVADVKQDTGAFTSEKTMEISANTNAEEKELEKSAKPVSKSRFSMSFSRTVPGRTNGPSTEPISGTGKLQANQESASVNTASVDKVNLQESSSQNGTPALKQQQLSAEPADAAEHIVKETEQPKQKEVSFFDKLFKQGDKGKPQNENQGDLKAESQHSADADREATELIHRLDNVHQYLETGDSSRDHTTLSYGDKVSQNSASKSPENFKEPEKENKADTPADDNSVMNFFKTLVTPTKSSSKTELGSQQASDDKNEVNGEHKEATAKSHKLEQKAAEQKISKTNDADSSDKAKLEKSPTQSPFGKLFKQKTIKEVPQVEQENVISTTDAKSEKGISQPQKQFSKQEIKSPESAQKVKSEEEEVKPAKKSFLNFFKQMSVKEDEKYAESAKGSEGKDSGLADDPTKKGHETRENSVPPAKKGKDSSRQKKTAPEGNQEEPQGTKSVEALPPSQQSNTVSVSIPNGNNIKATEAPEKRLEKKQSFGVFLKQLGGKKTADVAVQTDPVVIHPAGKTK
ncbi:breast carcinoma-amplified sequence 1 isoform X2 [Carcharodon carcharias]|uniref:breast carcinoma-amplified sequence 1 isoform X2 n=1 Tax=Carcharodon carcharias TaxID=13397 RepID=UPI001B7DF695|nr:breast carcinoma-amplified sequence 1 isoform X2 [Carcharodon carcharias]